MSLLESWYTRVLPQNLVDDPFGLMTTNFSPMKVDLNVSRIDRSKTVDNTRIEVVDNVRVRIVSIA